MTNSLRSSSLPFPAAMLCSEALIIRPSLPSARERGRWRDANSDPEESECLIWATKFSGFGFWFLGTLNKGREHFKVKRCRQFMQNEWAEACWLAMTSFGFRGFQRTPQPALTSSPLAVPSAASVQRLNWWRINLCPKTEIWKSENTLPTSVACGQAK